LVENVLVVLPTLNEAGTIREVLIRTREAVPAAEILVVDDASPDGTADIAEKINQRLGGIHVLRRDRRYGFSNAYKTGFDWGMRRGAQILVEMDADLSHDPAALPSLLDALANNDLVIGSRYVPGGSVPRWSLYRRFISRAGNAYSSLMLGLRVRDLTAGFRAYRADLLRSIDMDSVRADGYGFQVEMTHYAAQAGARIKEVPICFVEREIGQSKMSSRIVVEALLLVTRLGLSSRVERIKAVSRRDGPYQTEGEEQTVVSTPDH
jgi:dolichol-phosphate mannosyltransferase